MIISTIKCLVFFLRSFLLIIIILLLKEFTFYFSTFFYHLLLLNITTRFEDCLRLFKPMANIAQISVKNSWEEECGETASPHY